MPVSTATRTLMVLPALTASSEMAFTLLSLMVTAVMSYLTMTSAYMSGVRPRQMISSVAPASRRVTTSCRVATAKVLQPFSRSTWAQATEPWP